MGDGWRGGTVRHDAAMIGERLHLSLSFADGAGSQAATLLASLLLHLAVLAVAIGWWHLDVQGPQPLVEATLMPSEAAGPGTAAAPEPARPSPLPAPNETAAAPGEPVPPVSAESQDAPVSPPEAASPKEAAPAPPLPQAGAVATDPVQPDPVQPDPLPARPPDEVTLARPAAAPEPAPRQVAPPVAARPAAEPPRSPTATNRPPATPSTPTPAAPQPPTASGRAAPPAASPPAAGVSPGSGEGDRGVSVLANPNPRYPPRAQRLGIQGSVTVLITIGSDGRVVDAVVRESSGDADLDQEAISTVRNRWRFAPARRGGMTVQETALLTVRFHLR